MVAASMSMPCRRILDGRTAPTPVDTAGVAGAASASFVPIVPVARSPAALTVARAARKRAIGPPLTMPREGAHVSVFVPYVSMAPYAGAMQLGAFRDRPASARSGRGPG